MNEQDIEAKAAELLIAIGSKPLRNGSLTLHFDNEGHFQTVDVKFSRKVRQAVRTSAPVRTGSTRHVSTIPVTEAHG